MIYVHFYNERQGLNPKLPDRAFRGPVIGPISNVSWCRGFLQLHWADRTFIIEPTEDGDHLRYGGKLYNSIKIMTRDELWELNWNFCSEPIELHPLDIFSQLIDH